MSCNSCMGNVAPNKTCYKCGLPGGPTGIGQGAQRLDKSRERALEEAALECDRLAAKWEKAIGTMDAAGAAVLGMAASADVCAAKIRALKRVTP